MSDEIFKEKPAPLPERDRRLIEEYCKLGVPTDRLAFSAALDRLTEALHARGDDRSAEELLHRLLSLRKIGRLPRLVRSRIRTSAQQTAREPEGVFSDLEELQARIRELLDDGARRLVIETSDSGEWQVYR